MHHDTPDSADVHARPTPADPTPTHDARLRPGYQEYPKDVAATAGGTVAVHSAAHEAAVTGETPAPLPTPLSHAGWRALEAKAHAQATDGSAVVEDGYPKDLTVTVHSAAQEAAVLHEAQIA